MKKAGTTFVALLVCAGLLTAAAPASAHACAGADRSASSMSRKQVAAALRCVIAAERSQRGLRAWRTSGRLALAARRHARDMVRRRYFGHGPGGGSALVRRVRRTGFFRRCMPCRVGENLAWGAGPGSRPRTIVRKWLNSPPHRRVLLSSQFTSVGVGLARGTPRGRMRRAITAAMVVGGPGR